MREFRGYEYVDGDIRVYARFERAGQGLDENWEEQGVVKFDQDRQVETVAESLGLTNMDGTELARLSDELAVPRRH